MPGSATTLLVGPGALWDADCGPTEPVGTAVADARPGGGPHLGATDGAAAGTAARASRRVRTERTVGTPGRRLTSLDVSLATALAEPTLEDWRLSLADAASEITTGGAGATGYAAMDLGGPDEPGEEPDYRAVIFRGRAPQGRRRLVIVRKALSVEEVESEYKKDDQTFIPVTFQAHWVSTSIKSVHCVDERPIP